MEMKFLEAAKVFRGKLCAFAPYPKATDREAYDKLPANIKEQILKEGEGYLGYAYPVIRATDFMNFKRTGNRVDFEDIYFARRHALCGLVLAECVEHQGRFLDDIINGIFAICEESSWVLPPHNSYLRSEPQYILPDAARPVMDLFACETGATLAGVYYLLKEELDAISPFICKRILHELNLRIVTPYLTEHFWWMGKADEPMCNWTVWCTQNVLLSSFLVPFPEDVQEQIFGKAAESCDYFLKDYGDDGCCDEGAQYYRHAGLCLFGAMEILDKITNGYFAALYQWEKVKNIASYILNVHVDDKYFFNFADCSAIAGRAGVREYLFGKATKQEALALFAAKDFQAAGGPLYTDEVNQINLFYRLQTIFTHEEIMGCDTSAPLKHNDIYYPSVGLFITHSERLSLAVKAGDNDDSHNHNDTGSFTLYKKGQPVFADIGVESYTQKTFSPRRYEIWTMQSGYHNLPTINGLDEKDGADYRATELEVNLDAVTPSISMELATAYPFSNVRTGATHATACTAQTSKPSDTRPDSSAGRCSTAEITPISYRRTVTLHKEDNQVLVCDKTNAEDVILNFITYEQPTFEGNTLKIGELATAEINGASLLVIEVLPITDPRLHKAWDHDLYRVRLKMNSSEFRMSIK